MFRAVVQLKTIVQQNRIIIIITIIIIIITCSRCEKV